MSSINQFVNIVTHSRKRTGIIWLYQPDLLTELKACGVVITDLADSAPAHVQVSDDELLRIITAKAQRKSTAFLNLELFLAPRFKESGYLEFLLSKLIVREPHKPIYFIFYSPVLYQLFKVYYTGRKQTENHYFDDL